MAHVQLRVAVLVAVCVSVRRILLRRGMCVRACEDHTRRGKRLISDACRGAANLTRRLCFVCEACRRAACDTCRAAANLARRADFVCERCDSAADSIRPTHRICVVCRSAADVTRRPDFLCETQLRTAVEFNEPLLGRRRRSGV